jgi:hypothetical protein
MLVERACEMQMEGAFLPTAPQARVERMSRAGEEDALAEQPSPQSLKILFESSSGGNDEGAGV